MEEIVFIGSFGHQKKLVRIVQAHNTSDWGFQIYVNNAFCGDIVKRKGEWNGHLPLKSCLTSDDIQILGDMIDEATKKPP